MVAKTILPARCESGESVGEKTRSFCCGAFCVLWGIAGLAIIVGLVLKLLGLI